ncbi:MAG: autotransporter assembly complex family protein [Pseudomonadota bacterium]
MADVPLRAELEGNVALFLSLETAEQALKDRTVAGYAPAQLTRMQRQADAEVNAALAPFGFYESSAEAELEIDGAAARATVNVEPGPRVRLRSVRATLLGDGVNEASLRALVSASPLQKGTPLLHASYDAFKQALTDRAFDLGYLDARFKTADLAVFPDDRAADIELAFETGKQYRFGPVLVEQEILTPDFVDRLVEVETDEVFDVKRLIDQQLALNDTDYFSNVTVEADKEKAIDQAVPVVIHTEPQASQSYTTGLGFGTDTGPRATFGVEWRRLNKRGHQFSADLRTSAIRNTLAAEYRIPFKEVARDRWKVFARLDQAEIGDSDSDQFSVGVVRDDSWGPLRRQIYFKYNGERFSIGNEPTRDSRLLIPGLALSYQRADDPLFTRRGLSFSVDVHGALGDLASDTAFISTLASLRHVRPLSPRSRLLLRGELGYLEVDDFAALPPGERFFTGGDRTVRGYGFQTLSPENADGDDIGGVRLTAVSAEVDYLLIGAVGIAAFVDHGAASARFGDDLSTGVGLGLRYRSPVGMIRVDFAHPLDEDRSVRLHLTLGSDL